MRDLAVRRMDALAFRRMIRLAFRRVEKEKIKSNHALAFRRMIVLAFRRIEKQRNKGTNNQRTLKQRPRIRWVLMARFLAALGPTPGVSDSASVAWSTTRRSSKRVTLLRSQRNTSR